MSLRLHSTLLRLTAQLYLSEHPFSHVSSNTLRIYLQRVEVNNRKHLRTHLFLDLDESLGEEEEKSNNDDEEVVVIR